MSWHYLPELVVGYSGGVYSAGEQSAPLSSKITADEFSCSGSVTDCSASFQSGMTCEHSTGDRGVDAWILSLAASRARTSAQPAKVQALMASEAASGQSSRESLAKYDHHSRSWKTAQGLLAGGLAEFSETYPNWGTMRTGVLYRRKIPSGLAALRLFITSEEESGLSQKMPAPAVREPGINHERIVDKDGNKPTHLNQRLYDKHTGRLVQDGLTQAVKMFPKTEKLPTPTVCGNYNRKGASATSGDGLATAVVKSLKVPAPVSASKTGGRMGLDGGSNARKSMRTRGTADLLGGSLNPNWVEWLMGWPIGWTDLQPLEMGRFQQWLEQHGAS